MVSQRTGIIKSIEPSCLLNAALGLKYKAALSVAYGAGLRAAEVVRSESLTSTASGGHRVERGKGHKDRNVMHSVSLLELLRLGGGGATTRLALETSRVRRGFRATFICDALEMDWLAGREDSHLRMAELRCST